MSLPANVVHFANFLRRAGLPVGSGQVVDAMEALELVGIAHRRDVYWALHCVLVSKHEHDELFGYAFAVFWRDPTGANDELARLKVPDKGERRVQAPPRRILEAWREQNKRGPTASLPDEGEETDSPGTASFRERLRRRDFEQMSTKEIEEVLRLLKRLRFPWRDRPVRRLVRQERGRRFDLRGTLQRSVRTGGLPMKLVRRDRSKRPPPLVVLCDISGSMERYSRMMLHFLHALTNDRDRVEVFVFGTRLTRVTRALHHKDVDAAFAQMSATVPDWGGGTRIGPCLQAFNRRFSRRLLADGAEVLLVTDGLERDDAPVLEPELRRLAGFAKRIVWLNPLLRYNGFEAQTEGTQAMERWVTEHRPVHSLESLEGLARALAR